MRFLYLISTVLPFIALQLFVKLYPEQLQKSSAVEAFVQGVWSIVGSNKHLGVADDAVRSDIESGYLLALTRS